VGLVIPCRAETIENYRGTSMHMISGVALQISWMDGISDDEVQTHADQPPLTHIILTTHLKFFGHIACSVSC